MHNIEIWGTKLVAFSDIAKYLDKLDTEQRTEMYDCVNIVAEITEHLLRPQTCVN